MGAQADGGLNEQATKKPHSRLCGLTIMRGEELSGMG
jgi:hypothetical protein